MTVECPLKGGKTIFNIGLYCGESNYVIIFTCRPGGIENGITGDGWNGGPC